MDTRRSLLMLAALVAAAIAGIVPARASTVTYNLSGNPADFVNVTLPAGDPFTEQVLFLTDIQSGSSEIPGGTISTGDIVNANIYLSGLLTVPSESTVQLELQSLPDGGGFVINESVSYYAGGVKLAPPQGLGNIAASGPALVLGQLPQLTGPQPSFSFDTAELSATINNITENGQSLSTATVSAASPALIMLYPTPVPLPAALWLMLSGLGGLGVLAKRRS